MKRKMLVWRFLIGLLLIGAPALPASADGWIFDDYSIEVLPAGPSSYGFIADDTGDAAGPRTRELTGTTTLRGDIYSNSTTGTNQDPVTNQGSDATVTIQLD